MLGLVGRSSSTHTVDLTGSGYFASKKCTICQLSRTDMMMIRKWPEPSTIYLAIALFAVLLLSLAVTGDLGWWKVVDRMLIED